MDVTTAVAVRVPAPVAAAALRVWAAVEVVEASAVAVVALAAVASAVEEAAVVEAAVVVVVAVAEGGNE